MQLQWAGMNSAAPGASQQAPEDTAEPTKDVSDDDDTTMEQDLIMFKDGMDKAVATSTMETCEAASLVDVTEDLYISDNLIGEPINSTAPAEKPDGQDNSDNDGEFVMLNASEDRQTPGQ